MTEGIQERAVRRKRPNILFIMTDQFRLDGLGRVSDFMKSPNLDRLSAEGITFTNCITNSPCCMPARFSLATGLYPHNSGLWRNRRHDLPADAKTWMQRIAAKRYQCAVIGKTHLHHHRGDLRDRADLLHGFGFEHVEETSGPWGARKVACRMTEMWRERGVLDAYRQDAERRRTKPRWEVRKSVLPLDCYADTYVGQRAREWLAQRQDKSPWFCWVGFGGPHPPYDVPEPYASLYDPQQMPEAIAKPPGGEQDRPKGILDKMIAATEADPRGQPTGAEVQALRADYAGKISLIDDQIGEIFSVIEERGEWHNTVVVFTSDHGEMNGDFGLLTKHNFLNPAVKVPLILRMPSWWENPGVGGLCASPVELMDVGPTLVDCAKGRIRYQQFGKSLLPLVDDIEGRVRDVAVSEYADEIMMTDERWKLALNGEGEAYMLFDLESDPLESENLAGSREHEEIRCELQRKLLRRLVRDQVRI